MPVPRSRHDRRRLSLASMCAVVVASASIVHVVGVGASPSVEAPVALTFVWTGPVMQSWIVPAGVTSVDILAVGASGGGRSGGRPGLGATVSGTITVAAGSVLEIWVGGVGQPAGLQSASGGWGGRNGIRVGGSSGSSPPIGGVALGGGGGGGATEVDLRTGAGSPAILAIAGGGGGSASFSGSACTSLGVGGCGALPDGKGRDGSPGNGSPAPIGGGGGISTGGAGGTGTEGSGSAGGMSAFGYGGDGGPSSGGSGGGGGAGFGGGGGGGGASTSGGAGGGSGQSIFSPGAGLALTAVYGTAAGAGDGFVRLTFVPPTPTPTPTPTTSPSPLPNPPAGATRFVSVTPTRLLDTRDPSDITGGGAVAAGDGIDLQILGRAHVPSSNVSAVVLNVTASEALAPGFVSVWPSKQPRPTVSNLNVTAAGQNIANLVIVKVGANGQVSLFSQSGTHLVVDVAGYFESVTTAVAAGRFNPLSPTRVLDSRSSLGVPGTRPVPAGGRIDVLVTGVGGVPATGVQAVVLNVTAADALEPGFITVWPAGQDRPTASNVNVTAAGQNIANLVVVPVGASGQVSLYTQSGTHLIADVAGWYGDGTQSAGVTGLFQPLDPMRILDTRAATGVNTTTPVAPDGSVVLHVAGAGGAPSTGISAAVLNVTVANAAAPGFVTVWPTNSARPVVSNLNVTFAGQNIPNLVSVRVAPDGAVSLYTQGGGHLVADIAGYFTQ